MSAAQSFTKVATLAQKFSAAFCVVAMPECLALGFLMRQGQATVVVCCLQLGQTSAQKLAVSIAMPCHWACAAMLAHSCKPECPFGWHLRHCDENCSIGCCLFGTLACLLPWLADPTLHFQSHQTCLLLCCQVLGFLGFLLIATAASFRPIHQHTMKEL